MEVILLRHDSLAAQNFQRNNTDKKCYKILKVPPPSQENKQIKNHPKTNTSPPPNKHKWTNKPTSNKQTNKQKAGRQKTGTQ